MSPSMKVHVYWMNLMKNQIIQKFQSFEGNAKSNDSFLNHLIKQLCSMGSNCLTLDASHMCKK